MGRKLQKLEILHVTDLHYQKKLYRWIAKVEDRFDLICLTGDLLDERANDAGKKQIRYLKRWLAKRKTPVMICSGNHDYVKESIDWMKDLPYGDGQIHPILGLKIASAPEDCRDFRPYYDCDILLHHYPPKGTPTAFHRKKGKDVGSKWLAQELPNLRCQLLLTGHAHRPLLPIFVRHGIKIYNSGGDHAPKQPKYSHITYYFPKNKRC